jgi:hypothetical protein
MLTWRQQRALRLMFRMSDEEICEEIGVKLSTIGSWRKLREFRQALAAEGREIRAATARIASNASLNAAANLNKMIADSKDGKLMLDILKAGGSFEPIEEADGETLDDILRQVMGNESEA